VYRHCIVLWAFLVAVTFSAAGAERRREIRYIGPLLSTLDTYLYTGGMYAQVTLGTKEGLVQLSPEGRLVPAQAERWEVSEDGLTYTFYLRRDNRWYDGSTVTAHDYRAAFLYQMEPNRQSKWMWDTPLQYVKKALDFQNRAARAEEVGIDVLDDFTLRFRLAKPYPAFMNAMITGSMFPIHRGALARHGDQWHKLEHYQGNGPYRIVEWEMNSHVILEPNPNYNLPRGNLERVISRFAGRPMEAYQSNEVDFAGITSIADIYYAKHHPVLSRELVWTPTSGLSYLLFLFSENPVYWDARVRRAIAMGFDKRRIVETIFHGREAPVDMMSTPAMPDWDPGFEDCFDLSEARRLLTEAGYPGGKGIPESVILVPSYLEPERLSQFVTVAAMLGENLGIKFVIDNQELGVYADKRVSLNPPDYLGFCFAASGAPWPDPVYGAQWAQILNWTDDLKAYRTWWEGQRRIIQLRAGMIPYEKGGAVADVERVNREVRACGDSVLALHENERHGPYLRREAEEVIRGWRESGEDLVRRAKAPGADLGRLWKEMCLTILQVKQYHYQWAHASDLRWRLEEMRQEALHSRDPARRAEIDREMHRAVLGNSWVIPLHVMNYSNLVKPYVKGLKFCPYWWGNPLYMKWVSIEEDQKATERM